MRTNELTPEQQKVYAAIVELENSGRPGFLSDVAREARIDQERTDAVVGELLHKVGLIHEIPPTGKPDMGPEYRTEHRT